MPNLETYHGYPLWQYIPSLPAAVLFAIIFGLATLLHAVTLRRHRTWFCIPFVVGGIFEIIGYVGRALAYNQTGSIGPYVMQSVLLLLAPILFAASLYMTLGRVIRSVSAERLAFLPARWLTRLFVCGDCFSFLVQASGAGLIVRAGSGSNAADNTNLGQNIIVAGLILQIALFGVFCALASTFHARYSSELRRRAARQQGHGQHPQQLCGKAAPWQQTLRMLYVASAGIMARNVFRVVEYAQGRDGYTLSHEWCTYVFDGLLMLGVMAAFWLRYPNRLADGRGVDSSANSQTALLSLDRGVDGKHGRSIVNQQHV